MQILQQCCNRLIDSARVVGVTSAQIGVLVPTIVARVHHREFDEGHAALDQAARQQALLGVDARGLVGCVATVSASCRRTLGRNIHQLRHGALHAEGLFTVLQRSRYSRIIRMHSKAVMLAGESQHAFLTLAGIRRLDEGHAVTTRLEYGGLGRGRQEAGAPTLQATRRHQATINDHEAGQVCACITESIAHPRAHARTSSQSHTCV